MKRYGNYLILAITIVAGCKKGLLDTSPTTPPPTAESRTVRVVEISTNIPIDGASVTLQKCSKYDNIYGCIGYATINTLITNSAGEVTFKPPQNFERFEIARKNYWTARNAAGYEIISLIPKCTIKINLKKVNAYSPGDMLTVWIEDPTCYNFTCWSDRHTLNLPADTVIYSTALGNTNNQVSWSTTGEVHNLPPVYVNRFDTASVDIQY